jgi:hypothetical protein
MNELVKPGVREASWTQPNARKDLEIAFRCAFWCNGNAYPAIRLTRTASDFRDEIAAVTRPPSYVLDAHG